MEIFCRNGHCESLLVTGTWDGADAGAGVHCLNMQALLGGRPGRRQIKNFDFRQRAQFARKTIHSLLTGSNSQKYIFWHWSGKFVEILCSPPPLQRPDDLDPGVFRFAKLDVFRVTNSVFWRL